MLVVTTDRAAILHLAGFGGLSPALDPAAGPTFSSRPGDGLARCGWERFFAELRARGLAVAYEPGDATSLRIVPAAGAQSRPAPLAWLRGEAGEARRFLRALLGA